MRTPITNGIEYAVDPKDANRPLVNLNKLNRVPQEVANPTDLNLHQRPQISIVASQKTLQRF